MSRFNPFSFGTTRRPRRLTWYTVITQIFTLLGRLVGRAVAGGSASTGARKTTTTPRRRTTTTASSRRTTYRR